MPKHTKHAPVDKITLPRGENPETPGRGIAPPSTIPSWAIAGDSKATAAEIRDKYGFTPSLRFCEALLDYLTQRDNVQ